MSKVPFDAVVREHGPMVLRVCAAVLGPDHAEDAWSETFLAALGAYPDLDSGANVEAWLVTIAHRKAIDHVRRAARQARPSAVVPERPATHYQPGGWEHDLWELRSEEHTSELQTRFALRCRLLPATKTTN